MSSSLCYEPVDNNPTYISDIGLKQILEKNSGLPRIMSSIDINYLQGLEDAGIQGAKELIDAIKLHEKIRVFLGY